MPIRRKLSSTATITPEALLNDFPLEIRDLSEQLRDLIKETIPSVEEVAYPVWRGIGYHHPQQGYFCAIFPQKDCVRLSFEHGVDLEDPAGVLEGDGKQIRYITIEEDIPTDIVAQYLNLAVM
jgi:hypothetical protein